jgi:hypothetical protein
MPVYCCVYTIRRPSSITPRLFIYIFFKHQNCASTVSRLLPSLPKRKIFAVKFSILNIVAIVLLLALTLRVNAHIMVPSTSLFYCGKILLGDVPVLSRPTSLDRWKTGAQIVTFAVSSCVFPGKPSRDFAT